MKDFSNIGVKSLGQNGYRKYDDGLLIPWGYITGSASIKTTYLNSSFYDSNYNVSAIGVYNNTSEAVVVVPMLVSKTQSYFRMCVRFGADNGGGGYSPWPYYWFAIGRWK